MVYNYYDVVYFLKFTSIIIINVVINFCAMWFFFEVLSASQISFSCIEKGNINFYCRARNFCREKNFTDYFATHVMLQCGLGEIVSSCETFWLQLFICRTIINNYTLANYS
jgi:hypothetical protein